jgi:Chromo (CHRromatin Organisation MOdifier) domain
METAANPKGTSPVLMVNNIDTSPAGESSSEFVIEKIARLRKADDGSWMYKVRWNGYTPADDTWEPAHHLPGNMIRRYHRRVGLPLDY